jgi:hypothetical protein
MNGVTNNVVRSAYCNNPPGGHNLGAKKITDGDAHPVFVIRTTGILTQAANTKVILQRVNPESVLWQVAGNAVVGVGAHMAGVVLVKTDIALQTAGCALVGRAFAQTACILDSATASVC